MTNFIFSFAVTIPFSVGLNYCMSEDNIFYFIRRFIVWLYEKKISQFPYMAMSCPPCFIGWSFILICCLVGLIAPLSAVISFLVYLFVGAISAIGLGCIYSRFIGF